jgi:hypothetical protein
LGRGGTLRITTLLGRGDPGDDLRVYRVIIGLPEAAAEVHHHRGIKGSLPEQFTISQKALEVGGFEDLLDGLLVGDAQSLLDDQCAKATRPGSEGAPRVLSVIASA